MSAPGKAKANEDTLASGAKPRPAARVRERARRPTDEEFGCVGTFVEARASARDCARPTRRRETGTGSRGGRGVKAGAGEGERERAAGIALFDLDYTLLGGDATYEWIHFLIGRARSSARATRPSSSGSTTSTRRYARHHRFPAFRLRRAVEASARAAGGVAGAVSRPGHRADYSAQGARAHRLARGARPPDRDRHRRQQLRRHTDRAHVLASSICWRAIPKSSTASSPGASRAYRAFTRGSASARRWRAERTAWPISSRAASMAIRRVTCR